VDDEVLQKIKLKIKTLKVCFNNIRTSTCQMQASEHETNHVRRGLLPAEKARQSEMAGRNGTFSVQAGTQKQHEGQRNR